MPVTGLVPMIPVWDMERALEFYKLLGFAVGNRVPRHGAINWAWLYAPNAPDWRRGPNLMLSRSEHEIDRAARASCSICTLPISLVCGTNSPRPEKTRDRSSILTIFPRVSLQSRIPMAIASWLLRATPTHPDAAVTQTSILSLQIALQRDACLRFPGRIMQSLQGDPQWTLGGHIGK